MTSKYTVKDIVQWFIAWAEESEDTSLTPGIICKLLYFAKTISLRDNNHPLFEDRIWATSQGVTIPAVYEYLFEATGRDIEPNDIIYAEIIGDEFNWDNYKDIEDSLVKTWEKYGIYSDWVLKRIIIGGPVWHKHFMAGRYLTEDNHW